MSFETKLLGRAEDIGMGENSLTHSYTDHPPITNTLSSAHSFPGEMHRDTINFLSHLPGLLEGQAQAVRLCQWLCP